MASTAWPIAASAGNDATNVTGSRGGRGRIRKVADVITPRVPSDPMNSEVRSYPATSLRAPLPVRSTVPSARTTSRPSAESRVTPYLTHRMPPALVARLPPIVQISKLPGSGG